MEPPLQPARTPTCGPTLAHTLRLLQQKLQPGRGGPDAAAYSEYALALQSAYRERLQDMGDADGRRALGARIAAVLGCPAVLALAAHCPQRSRRPCQELGDFGPRFC